MNEYYSPYTLTSATELGGKLDGGMDADTRDEHGRTLLMVACRQGALALVELLIARGADVNARSPGGTTPLMYAKTAAFASGDTALIERLLKAGADINAKDNHGMTALQYTQRNAASLVQYLEANGAE